MNYLKYNGLMIISVVLLLVWALSSLILLERVTIDPPKAMASSKKN
ncbi:hypothetical protein QFZ77_002564 [Paenibacillus sp. V4I3]|nr:hypothetical protein [Paenibacillus sp. V4I3]MDQ0873905.1 hypothetical protein [Paenibacillus sp. V4I3]